MTAETAIRSWLGVAAGVGALLLATLALATRSESAAAQTSSCPNATVPASELSERALRRATTCLINRLRESRDRTRVRRDARLQRVAQRHTRVMVRTDCLRSRCPGQPMLQRRIRRSGYLDGARRWRFAQSTGCARTARAMVNTWRQRKFHRTNLLGARFRDLGVGVLGAVPDQCSGQEATFVALLAWRIP
jgi:uncharacterized protein YkwD